MEADRQIATLRRQLAECVDEILFSEQQLAARESEIEQLRTQLSMVQNESKSQQLLEELLAENQRLRVEIEESLKDTLSQSQSQARLQEQEGHLSNTHHEPQSKQGNPSHHSEEEVHALQQRIRELVLLSGEHPDVSVDANVRLVADRLGMVSALSSETATLRDTVSLFSSTFGMSLTETNVQSLSNRLQQATSAEQDGSRIRDDYQVLQQEIDRLQADAASVREDYVNVKEESLRYKDEIAALKAELLETSRTAESQGHQLLDENEALRQKLQWLESDSDRRAADCDELKDELERYKDHVAALNDEVARLHSELTHTSHITEEDSRKFVDENTTLKEEVSQLRLEAARAKEQYLTLKDESLRHRDENVWLREEVARLKDDNTRCRDESTKLKEENVRLKRDAQLLTSQTDVLHEQVRTAKDEISKMHEYVSALQKDQLDKEARQQQQEQQKEKDASRKAKEDVALQSELRRLEERENLLAMRERQVEDLYRETQREMSVVQDELRLQEKRVSGMESATDDMVRDAILMRQAVEEALACIRTLASSAYSIPSSLVPTLREAVGLIQRISEEADVRGQLLDCRLQLRLIMDSNAQLEQSRTYLDRQLQHASSRSSSLEQELRSCEDQLRQAVRERNRAELVATKLEDELARWQGMHTSLLHETVNLSISSAVSPDHA
jgi:predicted  nucleic acid-binding Zn-ribbon protein